MEQAVQNGAGQRAVVVKDLGPVFVGLVGREHDGTAFVALADDLEEQVGAGFVDGEFGPAPPTKCVFPVVRSVTSIISLVLTIAVVAFLRLLRRDRSLGIWAFLAMSFIIVCGVEWSNLAIDALGRDSDLSGRHSIFAYWPYFAFQHPLLGYGYAGFFSSSADSPAVALNGLLQFGGVVTFENAYMQLVIDFGALGFAIMLYIILQAVIGSVKYTCSTSDRRYVPFAILLFLLLGSLTVNSIEVHNTIFMMLIFYFYFKNQLFLGEPRSSRYRRSHHSIYR